jgi:hypothetical protein
MMKGKALSIIHNCPRPGGPIPPIYSFVRAVKLQNGGSALGEKPAKETERAVKPRASRLAGSTRGRASRSRRKSDVTRVQLIEQQTNRAVKKCAGNKKIQSVDKITSTLFLRPYNIARARNRTAIANPISRPEERGATCYRSPKKPTPKSPPQAPKDKP